MSQNQVFTSRLKSTRDYLKRDRMLLRQPCKNIIRIVISSVLLLSLTLGSSLGVTPVHALDVPEPVAPANGSLITTAETPPLAIPEFEWTTVSGALSYRLQVAIDVAFNTIIINQTTPNTTFTPTGSNVFPDVPYYWRVRVETPTPSGDWSNIWGFEKKWASPSNHPVLLSPVDGATIDFYDSPMFSWNPVIGAARYKLQIYTSPGGWSSTAYNATTITITHQPKDKLANGLYYWRVVPLDPGNREGTPSAEYSFTSDYSPELLLLEPEDISSPTYTPPIFTPTFRWTAVRGAQAYRLQYSTDPSFGSGITTEINTRNVAYTPTGTISNDVNYYWRVRVISGSSLSDWTEPWTFRKQWYIKPELLTPANLYQHQKFPVFSWTPVPGAAYYRVDLAKDSGFGNIYDTGNTANTWWTPGKYDGSYTIWYWRVTPYDGSGKAGATSNISSYVSYSGSVAPQQVYPLYYYMPDVYAGYTGLSTNPHEDRTVPLPIFIWHRVYEPTPPGNLFADMYRLQVSTDPNFNFINWTVDTENTTATPTLSNPFVPIQDTNYYWRVRPLIGGVEVAQWSQVWATRIDLTKGLSSTAGPAPTLIRPTSGFEFAEATPLFEWFPVAGATTYEVEIALDDAFVNVVDTALVSNPAYAPSQSLAQRNLGDLDFPALYWHVRVEGGTWSETRRFQVSAQSQWTLTRTLGAIENRLQIGSDSSSDSVDPDYELSNLQVAQSSNYWYFGFTIPSSPTKDVVYALYLDVDHINGSGADHDALGYDVTTISAYRPEYAIYFRQEGGGYSSNRIHVYHWNGSDWDALYHPLSDIGGGVYTASDYIEISVPSTGIGYDARTGTYAATLFSLPVGGGTPQDSVPSDPTVPGAGPISRFSNVTERMNLVMPPNNAGVDPSSYSSIQPFYWDWPIHTSWSGAMMKAYLDPGFTSEVATYQLVSDTANYASTAHHWSNDFSGDNTYYWRIQPDYIPGPATLFGVWTQGWRFEREGFVPQNLQTSISFATPTFSWDMVEGAEYYDIQVDDDPSFGSTAINTNTRMNTYTHTSTLPNATYYWRVRVHRNGNVTNNWTTSTIPCPADPAARRGCFTLNLPKPTGLRYEPSDPVVGRAPTLCWDPLIVNLPLGDPVLAAWKYRIQVSKDPSFTSIFDNVDTEQSCWTPTKGYDDGQYYWRAAILDGEGKQGDYASYQIFVKQYPVTTLLSPLSGDYITSTPTFVWTPVYGAAKYKLEVSLVANFATTIDSITTDNTRFTPTKSYAKNKTYYWRVAIMDADGKIGPYTNETIILDTYPFKMFQPWVKRR